MEEGAQKEKAKLDPKVKVTCFDGEEVVIEDREAENKVRFLYFIVNVVEVCLVSKLREGARAKPQARGRKEERRVRERQTS